MRTSIALIILLAGNAFSQITNTTITNITRVSAWPVATCSSTGSVVLYYGPVDAGTNTTQWVNTNASFLVTEPGVVSNELQVLSPNTLYYLRWLLVDPTTTNWSAPASFWTISGGPSNVPSARYYGVGQSNLNALVRPDSGELMINHYDNGLEATLNWQTGILYRDDPHTAMLNWYLGTLGTTLNWLTPSLNGVWYSDGMNFQGTIITNAILTGSMADNLMITNRLRFANSISGSDPVDLSWNESLFAFQPRFDNSTTWLVVRAATNTDHAVNLGQLNAISNIAASAIRIDGSNAMTGHLNLGGQPVTNVGYMWLQGLMLSNSQCIIDNDAYGIELINRTTLGGHTRIRLLAEKDLYDVKTNLVIRNAADGALGSISFADGFADDEGSTMRQLNAVSNIAASAASLAAANSNVLAGLTNQVNDLAVTQQTHTEQVDYLLTTPPFAFFSITNPAIYSVTTNYQTLTNWSIQTTNTINVTASNVTTINEGWYTTDAQFSVDDTNIYEFAIFTNGFENGSGSCKGASFLFGPVYLGTNTSLDIRVKADSAATATILKAQWRVAQFR